MPVSPASSATIEVLIRIWTQAEANAQAGPPAWTDGSPLILMLRQIVSLCGGTPHEASTGLLHAHFMDEFQAARAARHIQALVTGFAGAAGQRTLGASIGIVPAGEDHVGPLCARLQQRTQPAQILVASPRESPSLLPSTLPVRRVDGTASEPDLYELLWSHKEQAAAAAVEAQTRAAKQAQVTPPLPPQPRASSASASVWISAWATRAVSIYRSTLSFLAAVRQDVAMQATRSLRSLWQHRIWSSLRSSWSLWPALIRKKSVQLGAAAAAGVGVILTLAVLLSLHHRPASQAAPKAAEPSAVTSTPKPAAPATPAETSAAKPLKPGKTEPPPAKAQAPVEQEKPVRSRGDLSQEQTRQVLSRGQAELDRGCYNKAIAYYRRVLDDDPHNAAATIGIEKANTRKRLSGNDPQGHCQ